ncbi:MAG: hypothetical protein QOH12_955 [Solirubrobacteraceae bacterium]|jgi:SAM-dependent methyltransferase|nr:hypothetical protein [Solirubrobacteraceae bacterium]
MSRRPTRKQPTGAASATAQVAALRPAYRADLEAGVDRFFEPRSSTCPWCGSERLEIRLRTSDLFQHKPGRFVLEECGSCGHVFQNPRLNRVGLEFYYRDFYDGLGEERMDKLLSSDGRSYRSRAGFVAAHTRPATWLDVGTGYGHFPHEAVTVFPDTRFDGLDLTGGVDRAQQRGWIERGYRGRFTELAGDVAGGYDVISMFHYLEHTDDPRRELAAAARALRPGGYLVVEVPDPECRSSRLLGRWWLPWLQPQHLHLLPLRNLVDGLTAAGFTVLAEQHAQAHRPIDLVAAAWLGLDCVAPRKDMPWFPRSPGRRQRATRAGAIGVAAPALLVASLLDRAAQPVAERARLTNAYRVLAQLNA